jgi:uncharacterized Zn finger protein
VEADSHQAFRISVNTELKCNSCFSSNVVEVVAETCIHFPGVKGLKADPIFAFPEVVVCLDCGFVRSNLSEEELEHVRKGAARVKEAFG